MSDFLKLFVQKDFRQKSFLDEGFLYLKQSGREKILIVMQSDRPASHKRKSCAMSVRNDKATTHPVAPETAKATTTSAATMSHFSGCTIPSHVAVASLQSQSQQCNNNSVARRVVRRQDTNPVSACDKSLSSPTRDTVGSVSQTRAHTGVSWDILDSAVKSGAEESIYLEREKGVPKRELSGVPKGVLDSVPESDMWNHLETAMLDRHDNVTSQLLRHNVYDVTKSYSDIWGEVETNSRFSTVKSRFK